MSNNRRPVVRRHLRDGRARIGEGGMVKQELRLKGTLALGEHTASKVQSGHGIRSMHGIRYGGSPGVRKMKTAAPYSNGGYVPQGQGGSLGNQVISPTHAGVFKNNWISITTAVSWWDLLTWVLS